MKIGLSIVILSGALLTGCAPMQSLLQVASYAIDTPNFSLSRPSVYKTDTGLQLSGRVCRRARSTLLSPAGVRIEQITGDGTIAQVAHAGLPSISRRADQPCSTYQARVAWTLADGDSLRACFDHARACPADPTLAAPATLPAVPR